jgi:archaellum component FlaC
LFIDNNISYSGNTYPSFPKNKPFLLYKPTVELLDKIRQMNNEEIALLADSLSQRSFRHFQKEQIDKQLRENEQKHNISYTEEHIDAIYRNVNRDTKAGIGKSIQEVKDMLNGLSEEQYKQLARYLSYPRGVKIRDRESYNTMLRGRRVNQLMREVGKNHLDLMGMDLKDVKNWFAANLKGNAGRYMKTSSLIITYADLLTTGGHNLSSKISRVNSMTNYKRSRGSYTPTEYERPAVTEPVVSENRPTAPTSTTPSTTKPSSAARPAKKKSASTTTPVKSKPANSRASNTRPRSAVISTAPRRTRGL